MSNNPEFYQFDNGLKFIYEKSSNNLPISSIQIMCNVGSAHETNTTRGVAHFIEHMIFKGTKKLKNSREIYKVFDNKGTDFNASTNKRYTCYEIKCQDADVQHILVVIADLLLNSVFDKKEYKKELNVVIEENIEDKNDYEEQVTNNIEKMIYNGSGYENPIDCIEYHQDDNQFLYQDVLDFYNHYYVPRNFIISIVSNINFRTVLKYIKTTELSKNNKHSIGSSFIGSEDSLAMYRPPVLQDEIQYNIQKIPRSVDATYLSISFRTCSQYSNDKFALNMLKRILGGYFSSRMFLILREDHGLTYSSNVGTQYFENTGDFTITAITDNNKLIKNNREPGVLPLIIKMLNDIKRDGINEKELVLAKNYNKGVYILNMEDIDEIAVYNGEHVLLYQQNNEPLVPYRNIYKERYEPLLLGDIQTIVNKYLVKSNMNVSILGSQLPRMETIKKECMKLI